MQEGDASFMLGKIEGQLSQVITQLGVMDTRMMTFFADMEKRVSKVENRQGWYAGASGVAGIVFGWIGQGFWKGH